MTGSQQAIGETAKSGPATNYRICGLAVSSQIALPGAIVDLTPPSRLDVSIRRGPVPMTLLNASASGPTWQMTADVFLLRVPRLARFLIRAGRDIAVELEDGAEETDATAFLLGTAFGILLHQRGELVLHGAAVAKDGRAIAICGVSGAGKSTLAAALCSASCSFATDDLCVVGLDAERRPVVLPDGRQLKLWTESIDRLNLTARRGEPVRNAFEKYYIEPFDTARDPPRLSAIYVLRDARLPARAGIEALPLPDAMRTLEYESYRPGLRARMGQKPELLAHAAAVFGHANVFLLVRPRGFEHMPETVAALLAHWEALD